jgi:hypothetical protein
MPSPHDTEWRNFFKAMTEVSEAKRTNHHTRQALEEIEAIVMHT